MKPQHPLESPNDAPTTRPCDPDVPNSRGWIALVLLAALAAGSKPVEGGDTWLGIAVGRRILADRAAPRTDWLSHTFAGRPWINQNWLAHAGTAWLHDRIHPNALVGAKFMLLILMGLAVCSAAKRACHHTGLAAIVTSISLILARSYWDIRPQMLTSAALSFLMLAYVHARAGRTALWWSLPLVFAVWANAHGGFLLGLLIAIALASALARRPGRPMVRYGPLAVVAVCVAVTVVASPYGIDNLRHPFAVGASPVFQSVTEWRPVWEAVAGPPILGFVALAGWTSVLGILAFGFLPGRARLCRRSGPGAALPIDVPLLLLTFAGLVLAAISRRFLPPLCIIATPTLAQLHRALIARIAEAITRRTVDPARLAALSPRIARPLAILPTVLIIASALAVPTEFASPPAGVGDSLFSRMTQEWSAPRDAADYLQSNWATIGELRLLNDWTFGGYLAYRLPDARLYIDGRSQMVYDEAHLIRWSLLDTGGYRGRTMSDGDARAEFDAPFGRISIAIVRPASRLARLLREWQDWRLVHTDRIALVFRRNAASSDESRTSDRTAVSP